MKTTIITDVISNNSTVGYTPNQIKSAYNIGNIEVGQGLNVSVIDFFGNPYIQRNIDVFSAEFSLPKITLNMFDESYENNFDFSGYIEPSVDTQWVHAISPRASINVIRAPEYSVKGAINAIERALEIGTDILLMTFQAEFRESYKQYSSLFDADCVFIASAGDYGSQVNFPACMPQCIAVGGTSLGISENGQRTSEETVWEGTGGGICTYFEIPEYQRKMSGISELTDGMRGVPDVSFLADPMTGYSVYHSSVVDGFGWYRTGGTSVASSVIAGIVANMLSANLFENIMKRDVLSALYALAGETEYSNPFGKYIDITEGNNGIYRAMLGYDLCTGLGSLINL